MSTQSEELAAAIPQSLRLLARSISVYLDKGNIPMTLSQFSMLDFLLTNSEAVQTDLANHLHKDKSVILRQLDQLEQQGWVERQQDPNDRRRKYLVVTKAGQEIHRKGAKIRDKVRVSRRCGTYQIAASPTATSVATITLIRSRTPPRTSAMIAVANTGSHT